jgi:hypothetical protein
MIAGRHRVFTHTRGAVVKQGVGHLVKLWRRSPIWQAQNWSGILFISVPNYSKAHQLSTAQGSIGSYQGAQYLSYQWHKLKDESRSFSYFVIQAAKNIRPWPETQNCRQAAVHVKGSAGHLYVYKSLLQYEQTGEGSCVFQDCREVIRNTRVSRVWCEIRKRVLLECREVINNTC